MRNRIELISLAVGVLCAAAAALGAPLLAWANIAGLAAGLLVYALVRRDTEDVDGSDKSASDERISNQGSGAGSKYHQSKVFNLTFGGKRKS